MELKIEHISKQFKDKIAVDDVSLTLTPGVWVHSAAANGRWCGDQRPPCGLKTAG